ncbi:MAG TPA: hypothetical protein VFO61_02115 [Alphaproteobacteria bacterium]|nr:hypothetical protein [Alphaproteobacteria bacterium]
MLDITQINTTPGAAQLSVYVPKKDTSLAASVGPTTTVTSDGPDLWHRLWGKDGFSFASVLDIVNPLQHIPVVSTVYQKLTGDVASPGADLVGGALFGGPIGLAVAAVDTSIKGETGAGIGGHVLALFDSGTSDAGTAVAQADNPTPTPTQPSSALVAAAVPANTAPQANDASSPASSDQQQAIGAASKTAAEADKTDSKPAASSAAAASEAAAPAPSAEAKTDKTDKDAAPKPTAATVAEADEMPKSAFVLAHSSPRSYSGKGAGSAFVPLETRSTILPAAYFAPPPMGAPDGAKSAKSAQPFPPDPKTLAADPALLRQFQAAKTPNPFAPTAKGATPLPATADAAAAAADPSGFAALMQRNLERYMALHNKGAAPTVNKHF